MISPLKITKYKNGVLVKRANRRLFVSDIENGFKIEIKSLNKLPCTFSKRNGKIQIDCIMLTEETLYCIIDALNRHKTRP